METVASRQSQAEPIPVYASAQAQKGKTQWTLPEEEVEETEETQDQPQHAVRPEASIQPMPGCLFRFAAASRFLQTCFLRKLQDEVPKAETEDNEAEKPQNGQEELTEL